VKAKLLILTLILLIVPVSMKAQTMGPADNISVSFGGLSYDEAVTLQAGMGSNVFGDIWVFKYVEVGQAYASLATEIVAMYHFPESRWSVGAIGGPNVDWLNELKDNVSPQSYIVGAVGGLVTCTVKDNWGVVLHGKRKVSLENNNYPNGYNVGLAVWFDI
jgi:hypothetical protein